MIQITYENNFRKEKKCFLLTSGNYIVKRSILLKWQGHIEGGQYLSKEAIYRSSTSLIAEKEIFLAVFCFSIHFKPELSN